jgi:peptidoglycan/xylan/chitin deacetylase (PgdA/CDA1 family)
MCRQVAMTWDEIRIMAREPLATIGAHTLNHYNLKKMTETDARREMVQSREIIEQELQKPVLHFAYPYGNKDAAGPREFALARSAGFETAVVTRLGTVEAAHANHMHSLPRIMLSGRYQETALVNALVSGVPGRLANAGGAVNVG